MHGLDNVNGDICNTINDVQMHCLRYAFSHFHIFIYLPIACSERNILAMQPYYIYIYIYIYVNYTSRIVDWTHMFQQKWGNTAPFTKLDKECILLQLFQ